MHSAQSRINVAGCGQEYRSVENASPKLARGAIPQRQHERSQLPRLVNIAKFTSLRSRRSAAVVSIFHRHIASHFIPVQELRQTRTGTRPGFEFTADWTNGRRVTIHCTVTTSQPLSMATSDATVASPRTFSRSMLWTYLLCSWPHVSSAQSDSPAAAENKRRKSSFTQRTSCFVKQTGKRGSVV
jgi:hypothetical protein